MNDNLVKREDCDFGGKQGVKAAVDEFLENNDEHIEGAALFMDMCLNKKMPEFLTVSAYQRISRSD